MARTWVVLVAMLVSGPASCGEAQTVPSPSQRIVIVAEDDEATRGLLYRFEGEGERWQRVGSPVPVVFGRGGVGPKVEGDGKSPEGLFALGTAFGYSETGPPELRLPYLPLAPGAVCVDDPASPNYNRILSDPPGDAGDAGVLEEDGPGYRSAEQMRRDLAYGDALYEHGIVIQYNAEGGRDPDTGQGLGSCIFLHVWRSDSSPTAGCTAMAKGDLLTLLAWLDPELEPRLVQGSRAYLEELTRKGDLPFPVPAP